jgi:hypothetical protein
MVHTVNGIRTMHVQLIKLEVKVCQPKQDCAECNTTHSWFMGLDVRYIYCSKCFFFVP